MVSSELLRALAALESRDGNYPAGYCLFQEGDHPEAVWVLKNGTLGLQTTRFSAGNPLHAVASKKRLWGIRELVTGVPMQFTGIAETAISGYRIPKTVIHRAMRENASLRLLLMQAIAWELTQIPQSVVE